MRQMRPWLLLAVVATMAATASVTARPSSAGRLATPLDGLIFRDTGKPDPLVSNSAFIRGCEGTVLSTTSAGGGSVGTTLRASDAGWTVASHGRKAGDQNAQVGPVYAGAGALVMIHGSAVFDRPGGGTIVLNYSTPRSFTDCAQLTPVASSAAGSVYTIEWNASLCDNASCSWSHDIGLSGSGCASYTFTPLTLISVTVQLGGCTPSAFPAAPKPVPVSGSGGLTPGVLDGLLVRLSGDALETMAGQRGVCSNAPKLKYTGQTIAIDLLRKPAHAAVATPEFGYRATFGMDVNVHNQAYTWGASLALVVRGATRPIVVNQTDPAKSLNCRTRPKPQFFKSALPVGVWVGRTYLGRAWMKTSIAGGGGWSVLVAFGKPNFGAAS